MLQEIAFFFSAVSGLTTLVPKKNEGVKTLLALQLCNKPKLDVNIRTAWSSY